jgi:hypothetical protein
VPVMFFNYNPDMMNIIKQITVIDDSSLVLIVCQAELWLIGIRELFGASDGDLEHITNNVVNMTLTFVEVCVVFGTE